MAALPESASAAVESSAELAVLCPAGDEPQLDANRLHVYHVALELHCLCSALVATLNRIVKDQLERASLSVVLNIAEAGGRRSRRDKADALDQRTTYTYDEQGNRTSQTDANGHVTRFEYDALGRETKRILPAVAAAGGGPTAAAFETKTYDTAGNVETRTDFLGRTTTYAYDADTGRLLSRTYPNPEENVSFTYTATGRRRTAVDARGTTAYDYDVRDRLKSLTYPDGRSLGYDYDPQGNRTKLTALIAATSLVVNSSYDELGRLAAVTDPAGRVYTHGYDPNGNRGSLAHPNGAVTAYGYDALNRLTSLTTTHPATARHIQGYAFTLGLAGNRTRIVESAGLPQQRTLDYSYDSLYRLTGETVTESLGVVYARTFGYDAVGNRLSQATTLGPAGSPGPQLQPGTVGYGYDERDRLLSEQLQANPATAYGWDANGNLTTKDGEATYTWDHENRLKRVEKADGTVVEHAYDADGNRVRTKVTPPTGPPEITDYLVDTSGPLSHVVAETDGAATTPGSPGTLKAYYVRGDDLLAVMRPLVAAPAEATPADWKSRYYHADGLGSIRRLTDEQATITDGYTYSAFGELLAHTGSDPQPYAFSGEPLDLNSGWQYHRARWMDPGVGRFVGMDPWEGFVFEPATLHKYLYAAGDAVNLVDPTGRDYQLPASLTALSGAVTVALSNFGARIAGAFAQGGPVLGQLFQDIGRYAQATGFQVLQYYQRLRPGFQVLPEQLARTRVIDYVVKFGDKTAWLEMKYGLPWKWGEPLVRLVDQAKQALATGRGEVVVWSLKEPVARQLNLVRDALGTDAGRVRLVYGVQGLWTWLSEFFGPV